MPYERLLPGQPNRPFIPVAGAVRAIVRQTYMGHQYVNAVGLIPMASGLQATAQALCDGWASHIKGFCSNRWQLDSVELRELDTEFGNMAVATPTVSATGEGTSPGMPRGVAAVISLHAGTGGRSRRGRIFLAGNIIGHLVQATNTWDPTLQPTYVAAFAALDNELGATANPKTGLAVVSYSRKPDGTRRVQQVSSDPNVVWDTPEPGSVHKVTTATLDPRPGSQRKRN